MSNEFNGLKVTLTVAFAIPLNKEKKKEEKKKRKKRLFSLSTSSFTQKPEEITIINKRN